MLGFPTHAQYVFIYLDHLIFFHQCFVLFSLNSCSFCLINTYFSSNCERYYTFNFSDHIFTAAVSKHNRFLCFSCILLLSKLSSGKFFSRFLWIFYMENCIICKQEQSYFFLSYLSFPYYLTL